MKLEPYLLIFHEVVPRTKNYILHEYRDHYDICVYIYVTFICEIYQHVGNSMK